MDVREKLVKQAISHFEYGVSHDIFSEPVTTYAKLAIEALEKEKESCVTVLPVQVGDTVYGRFLPYGQEVQQCEVVKSKLCQFKDGTVRYFLDLEFNIIDPYFNDGRLMRCSTQAVYGADFGNWYRVYLTREEAESTPPKEVE